MLKIVQFIFLLMGLSQPIISQITVYSENFDAGIGGWTPISVTDASDNWTATAGVIEMNGYGGGNDEDWIISPAINLNTQTNEYLMFDYNDNYNGNFIELYYSTNYNGGGTVSALQTAVWTPITLDLLDIASTICFSTLLQNHRAIDVSTINGNSVYFAFKYTGTSTNSKDYKIDNVHIEADYYATVNTFIQSGGNCASLKTEIHQLIRNMTQVVEYSATVYDLWDALLVTDKRMNDAGTAEIVWDMFTDKPTTTGEFEFHPCNDRDYGTCGTPEGSCYNREHTLPRSWWGGTTTYPVDTMNFDLHHICPADKAINLLKFNYPPGKVITASGTGSNGFKVGTNSAYSCSSMEYFEPIDAYKGDYARMYLFMAARYETKLGSWYGSNSNGDCALTGNSYPGYAPWMINVLLLWHANDPVSQKEIDRNNAVYAIQGNRNPFIDHPDWVGFVWGNHLGTPCNQLFTTLEKVPTSFENTLLAYPNPTTGHFTIDFGKEYNQVEIKIYTIHGKEIQQGIYDNIQLLNLAIDGAAGIYLIEVKDSASRKAVFRMLKE